MQQYIPILKNSPLFSGVTPEEMALMFSCLGAFIKTYSRGEYLFREGEETGHITVLISGELHIQRDDYWGDRSIISHVEPGNMFGEAYLSSDNGVILYDVAAAKDSTVIFFDINRILTVCPSACPYHTRVMQNLFYALSDRNRYLVQKLGHMSRRTTREKLISYLSEQADRNQSNSFTIPFNRQQLADFLSVDRSAMSSELGKMRDEGLITFNKNSFTLL